MDGNTPTPRRLEPIEKWLTGEVEIVRTKRLDPSTGDVREIVFGPGMQTDKSHSTWIKSSGQKANHIWIAICMLLILSSVLLILTPILTGLTCDIHTLIYLI
jgi:hypothetical protein